jgi:hypothetical protein
VTRAARHHRDPAPATAPTPTAPLPDGYRSLRQVAGDACYALAVEDPVRAARSVGKAARLQSRASAPAIVAQLAESIADGDPTLFAACADYLDKLRRTGASTT